MCQGTNHFRFIIITDNNIIACTQVHAQYLDQSIAVSPLSQEEPSFIQCDPEQLLSFLAFVRRDDLVAFIVDTRSSCPAVLLCVVMVMEEELVMVEYGELKVVGVEGEGEAGDEVRGEERVYPRTGGQGDRGEDRGERHCRARYRCYTLTEEE